MQQTLLALLALMIATMLNFNQMQAQIRTDQQAVRAELHQMALGVAMESMEVVRARAYDEVTNKDKDEITVPDDFSPPGEFGDGSNGSRKCKAFHDGSDVSECYDIDDFHKMEPATKQFELPDAQFDFRIEMEVRYVNADLDPVNAKTRWKEVIISVQDVQDDGDSIMTRPITFSEVLAYK
jgi:hypothetical protein